MIKRKQKKPKEMMTKPTTKKKKLKMKIKMPIMQKTNPLMTIMKPIFMLYY